MPEFIAEHTPANLDRFTADYLDAAEWLINEDDKEKDCNGWSPEAIEQAKADCGDFQNANAYDLGEYGDITGYSGGVDFWLTRNHHGSGFWDRGDETCFKSLTEAAHAYGACDVYLGDDGFLYLA